MRYAYNGTNLYVGGFITNPPLNTWNHIAWVRSSGSMKIYLNGAGNAGGAHTGDLTDSSTVTVGGEFSRNGSFTYNGYIADLRVVKGTAVYTANFTPPTAPLTAISGTQLLLKGTDGGIIDRTGRNVIETRGYTTPEPGRRQPEIRTQVKKYGSSSIFFGGGSALDALFVPTNRALAFESGDFTVEFWVNFTSIANRQDLVWWVPNDDTLRAGILWRQSGDALAYYDASVGGAINAAWLPTAGTWYHIALSRSGSTTRLFIDGTSVGTYGTVRPYAASYRLFIGKDSASDSYPFTGYMDDFRITKGVARYTANFSPPTAAFNIVGPTTRSMQYLVVGGGGGGGHYYSGGGGGGGVQASTVSAVTGVTYTVTVGTGGAGGSGTGSAGSNGNASSITGSGFGIQGVGGQGGGGVGQAPPGGSINMTGGASGAPQSYAGGASVVNVGGVYRTGGGGGAGAVGVAGASANPDGGIGAASSITGTSILYGGGGGGGEGTVSGNWGRGSPWTLNIGGGGAGGGNGHPSPDIYGYQGAPGIENLGGGGGGAQIGSGGSGGKGVVIIKILDSITATVTGSPVLVTSGGYKVYTFNSTGTISLA
jgi:hypothetical protein